MLTILRHELVAAGYEQTTSTGGMSLIPYRSFCGKEILLYFSLGYCPPPLYDAWMLLQLQMAAMLSLKTFNNNKKKQLVRNTISPCLLSVLSFYPGPRRTEP
jgi:hypothetical protein